MHHVRVDFADLTTEHEAGREVVESKIHGEFYRWHAVKVLAKSLYHHGPADCPIEHHPMDFQILVLLKREGELGEPGAALSAAPAHRSALKSGERELGEDGYAQGA